MSQSVFNVLVIINLGILLGLIRSLMNRITALECALLEGVGFSKIETKKRQ